MSANHPENQSAEELDLHKRRELLTKNFSWITVLSDDDTYSGLNGSWIAVVNGMQAEALDAGNMNANDLPTEQRVSLRDLLKCAIDSGMFDTMLDEGVNAE